MPTLTSLSRKIAKRLGAKSSTASWSRPVVRIATVGVAIGMALIVVATSIVHGFQQEVKELVVGFGSDIQVLSADYDDQKIVRQPALESSLSGLDGVRAVHPFYTLPGILESQNGVKGVVAKGLNEETTQAFLERFMVDGNVDLGEDGAVLSMHQAQRLELETADRFTVYLIGGPNGVRPRNFRLTGTYRTGLLEYDQEFMFLPAAWIQEAAGWGLEMQVLAEGQAVELRSFGSRAAPVYLWHRRNDSGTWERTREVVGSTASLVPEAGAEPSAEATLCPNSDRPEGPPLLSVLLNLGFRSQTRRRLACDAFVLARLAQITISRPRRWFVPPHRAQITRWRAVGCAVGCSNCCCCCLH